MQAAASRATITPPVGTELAGWGFGPSKGVLDDLHARVLILEDDDGERFVLVSADLLGLDPAYADTLRGDIAGISGAAPRAVTVACSHTHSGPATLELRHWGRLNRDYLALFSDRVMAATAEACGRLEPARIGFGAGRLQGVAVNRTRDNAPVDDSVPLVRVDRADGQPLAMVMNFSCHAVAAHSYGNLISGDFPGQAARRVEAQTGAVALYTAGASGNVNPSRLHHADYARDYGDRLAAETVRAARDIRTGARLRLAAAVTRLALPVRPLPSDSELEAEKAQRRARIEDLRRTGKDSRDMLACMHNAIEWADDVLALKRAGTAVDHLDIELQAVRLNGAVMAAIPGEPFVEIGLNIKRRSPLDPTIVVELANGAVNYFPTADRFDDGGYEAEYAPKIYGIYHLTRDCPERIENAAVGLIETLAI
jgi:hypothetical protein